MTKISLLLLLSFRSLMRHSGGSDDSLSIYDHFPGDGLVLSFLFLILRLLLRHYIDLIFLYGPENA